MSYVGMGYGEAGFVVTVSFDHMTRKEEDALRRGRLEVKALMLGDAIHFMFKFGSLSWMDTTFTAVLAQDEIPPVLDDSSGYALSFNFEDPVFGQKGGRIVGLGNKMSKQIYKWTQEQLKKPFDVESYMANIDRIYAAYSTNDLVRMATVRSVFDPADQMHVDGALVV